jgi:PRD1 phage membrane DNA delivery
MTDNLISSVVAVLTAIIGVAIIAVLVSKQANTTGVIQAGGQAFSGALGTALSPVTGQTGFNTSLGGASLPISNL